MHPGFERGDVDTSFVYQDGSVRRLVDVTYGDEDITAIEEYTTRHTWANPWHNQLPTE